MTKSIEEKFSSYNRLLARPGQPLEHHLSNLRKKLFDLKFRLPFFELAKDSLRSFGEAPDSTKLKISEYIVEDLMKILVVCHDFGKISPVFQYKIRQNKVKATINPLSYHTKTSSIFSYLLLENYFAIEKNEIKNSLGDLTDNFISLFKILIPYSIASHHSPLIKHNLLEYLKEAKVDTLSTISLMKTHVFCKKFEIGIPGQNKQIGYIDDLILISCDFSEKFTGDRKDIIKKSLDQLGEIVRYKVSNLDNYLKPIKKEIVSDEFEDLIEDITDDWNNAKNLSSFLPFYLTLHSMLCDLDEWDARTFIQNTDSHSDEFDWSYTGKIPLDTVKKTINLKFKPNGNTTLSQLNRLRNILFNVLDSNDLSDKPSAYIIEAPTGSAKTYAMINLAVRLANKHPIQTKKFRRIIYALPFISITDQVGNVVDEILSLNKLGKKELLTIHHSFSDLPQFIVKGENFVESVDEIIVGKASYSTRLWHNQFIVTTFVSFLNLIFSGKKKAILRFHRLIGSIIILDEVQSLPPKYWKILSKTINFMIEYLNIDFIIGSATNPRPLVNSVKSIVRPTLNLPRDILDQINRYEINFLEDLSEIGMEDLIEYFKNNIEVNKNNQILIVLNTKKSCRDVYDFVDSEFKNYSTFLLSTWVRPIDRKNTIQEVENLLAKNKPVILVTTQVIEAGIDLDFSRVYRDMAPLDSIIQVAGRCNRNNRNDRGVITLFNLVNDEGKPYANLYDLVTLEITNELLLKENNLDEIKLRSLIPKFYEKIKMRKITSELTDLLDTSNLGKLFSDFKLIEETYDKSLAILPDNLLNKFDITKKSSLKLLNLYMIGISSKLLNQITNYNKLKYPGVELYLVKESEFTQYSPLGGFNPKFDAT